MFPYCFVFDIVSLSFLPLNPPYAPRLKPPIMPPIPPPLSRPVAAPAIPPTPAPNTAPAAVPLNCFPKFNPKSPLALLVAGNSSLIKSGAFLANNIIAITRAKIIQFL